MGRSTAFLRPPGEPVDSLRNVVRVDEMAPVGLVVIDVEARTLERLARLTAELDTDDGVATPVRDEDRQVVAAEVGLPAIDRRDEAGEDQQAGGLRAVAGQAGGVTHDRAHRE